jgi:Mrp family chromosome partitioning ATPase/capsular polysaccharide biosynthesis protein
MATGQFEDKDAFAAEPRAIDLREYWHIVRRRWPLVVVTALVGAALGAGYVAHAGRAYGATAEVLVAPVTQGPLNLPSQVTLLVNMSTEQAVAQSGPVIDQAAKLMHVSPTVLQADAAKDLTVAVPTTSDVLQITWQAKTAKAAQAGANAFADAYLSYRHGYLASQIANLRAVLTSQVKSLQNQIARAAAQLSTVPPNASNHQSLSISVNQLTSQLSNANSELASLPTYDDSGGQVIASSLPLTPSGLGHSVILIMGGLIGLILGLVIAFTRDVFDDRVRNSAQFERKLGAATLAILPPAGGRFGLSGLSLGGGPQSPRGLTVAIAGQPDSRAAESIRWLRGTFVAAVGRTVRTILVVGADASVSSSRIVAELGVALTEAGRSTLLIAADVYGSALPRIFDLSNEIGLVHLLRSSGDPETFIMRPNLANGHLLPHGTLERLTVLPSGVATGHERSCLHSDVMTALLQRQRETHEFVLLDCPPAAAAADVVALAAQVDGVIVVGRAGRTKGRALGDLRRLLDQVGAHLVGGVFISKGRIVRQRSRIARPYPSDSSWFASPERDDDSEPIEEPSNPVTQPSPTAHDDLTIHPSDQGSLAKRPT